MLYADAMLFTTIIAVVVTSVSGFGQFRDRIPNGHRIGHPCRQGQVWDGVGHQSPAGGGPRNPFGLAFKANGKMWTVDLCKEDSDGDNYTNGEELGDPDCTWTLGATPSRSTNITHPGICEPWNSENCKRLNDKWVEDECSRQDFHCPAIYDKDVMPYTMRLNKTIVPDKETTYICQIFQMPKDEDLHLVAATPMIDNQNILHHIVVFACDTNMQDSDFEHSADTPYVCDMFPDQFCKEVTLTWTLGLEGLCMHEHAGYRIGMRGFTRLALQLHWNNPEHAKSLTDSSGLKLFLTRKLRPYDAGTFVVGQMKLIIPPKEPFVSFQAGCRSECARETILGPINVTEAVNHMHYLGRQQFLDLVRSDGRVKLAHDPDYHYDKPTIYQFKDPVSVNPGDEFVTRCVFNSTSKETTTVYGFATADEMCLSFISYYPRQNTRRWNCQQYGTISSCEISTGIVQGCKFKEIISNPMNPLFMTALATVKKNCDPFGDCRKECKEAVVALRRAHPCLRGDVWKHIKRTLLGNKSLGAFKPLMMEFLAGFDSCNAEIAVAEALSQTKQVVQNALNAIQALKNYVVQIGFVPT